MLRSFILSQQSLVKLDMRSNYFRDFATKEFLEGLHNHPCIEDVNLSNTANFESYDSRRALARFVATAMRLKKLNIVSPNGKVKVNVTI